MIDAHTSSPGASYNSSLECHDAEQNAQNSVMAKWCKQGAVLDSIAKQY